MALNFNSNPYYDDYDETKNFYRFLFKPGYAVQARELTQLQTTIQNQIGKFGTHIFKEGSLVLGGRINLETNIDTVRLTDPSGAVITDLETIIGKVLVGESSGVRAYVIEVAYASDWNETEDILMVRYITSGIYESTYTDVFVASENLQVEETATTISQTVKSTGATGKGSIFSVDEGVIFSKGYFISFEKQTIVIDPVSQAPTAKVGFESFEEIINSNQDSTLLDPALGSYNYSAPGADRLKVSANLVSLDVDDNITIPDFTALCIVKDGLVVEQSSGRSDYNILQDELAKRTFDESGDYVINGFGVRIREHLDTGTNEGYLSLADGGDVNYLVVGVEPGTAYVKGYEINNQSTTYLETLKSTTSLDVQDEVITATNGNYLELTQVVGTIVADEGSIVYLRDTAETRVTSKIASTISPTGSSIGTAKVKSFEYAGSGSYRLYLFDVQMTGSNVFANTRAIHSTTGDKFFGDVVLTFGDCVLQDTLQSTLLYSLGTNATKNVRATGSETDTDTDIEFKRTSTASMTTGEFSITIGGVEDHPYGTTTLGDASKQQIIVTLNESINVQATGTVSTTTGEYEIIGSATNFNTAFNVGDKVTFSSDTNTYIVDYITDSTHMNVTTALSQTLIANNLSRVYLTGDIIDMTGNGLDGVERSISTTSGVINFNLQENITSSTDKMSVTYPVVRPQTKEIKKTLVPNIYVHINCSTIYATSATVGIDLGFSDVYQIKEIRKKQSSEFTSATEGTVVTDEFKFDNGQRDDFYDHATILSKTLLSSSDYLLIKLDYFKPDYSQGVGYFSVDSYPIDDTTEDETKILTAEIPIFSSRTTGKSYNLRNYLDFRPVKTNTCTDETTVAGAVTNNTNPSNSNTFQQDANGLRIPTPASRISLDYSYYLSRKDIVGVDYEGNFLIFNGKPSLQPDYPEIPSGVMALSELYIPPYPSLATTYARILGKESDGVKFKKVTNKRFTMRDIGVLKQRIENLEYYNAVNLLEKSAIDMLIPDANGVDRFKNGFFVDGFLDHSLGATYNSDYNITVDKKENCLRPVFEMKSFKFDYQTGTNVSKNGTLISLPYTEELLLEQSRVTTYRNIEQSVFRFIGNMYLTPEVDVWCDVDTVDKSITIGSPVNYMTTEWGSWETYQTGTSQYNVYKRRFNDRSGDLSKAELVGSFSSLQEAQQFSTTVGTLGVNNTAIDRGYIETTAGTTGQTRTGIQTVVTTEKDVQQTGELIKDVSIIPYIRPQTIDITVLGLKANTQYYTFFDDENMNDYVSPQIIGEVDTVPTINQVFDVEGADWVTNSYGILSGRLRLPADGKRFRVGSKDIIVTDSPTNSIDASSYSKGTFFAEGIHVEKNNTITTTFTPKTSTTTITETIPGSSTKQKVQIFGPSCMAYTFKVDVPRSEPGIFLTSIDVFVKQVHPTLGVWFEIREMSSDGGITRNQVPYTEMWYKSSEVTTTDDGSVPHEIVFPSPVFLQNDTEYALVIHTEGLNPDTYFWVSRLGETDVLTGKQVTGRQLTGSVYTTNNNLNWDIVPDLDLKVKFYRAKYDVVSSFGANTTILGTIPYDFFTITSATGDYSYDGNIIRSSQKITLDDNTFDVGYTLTQGSNVALIIAKDGFDYYTNTFSFTANTTATSNSAVVANVVSVTSGTGTLIEYKNNRMILENTNGNFFVNATVASINSTGNIVTTGTLASIDSYVYSTMNFKPRYLSPQNSIIKFDNKNTLNSTTSLESTYHEFIPSTSEEFDYEYIIESASADSSNSSLMRVTLGNYSDYLSPVVDVAASHAVFVSNLINDDVTDEENATGGNLINKYISKIVTLADGQDAEDLMVTLTAYMPVGTDVKVWMRIRNGDDLQQMSDRPWIEMDRDVTIFSSPANKGDYKEFTYSVPASYLTGPDESIQYVSSTGSTLTTFKQFSVKIGLLGTDSSIVPKVGDLRAIALQK